MYKFEEAVYLFVCPLENIYSFHSNEKEKSHSYTRRKNPLRDNRVVHVLSIFISFFFWRKEKIQKKTINIFHSCLRQSCFNGEKFPYFSFIFMYRCETFFFLFSVNIVCAISLQFLILPVFVSVQNSFHCCSVVLIFFTLKSNHVRPFRFVPKGANRANITHYINVFGFVFACFVFARRQNAKRPILLLLLLINNKIVPFNGIFETHFNFFYNFFFAFSLFLSFT